MKEMKEKVIEIIAKGNEKIGHLNKSIEKIKSTPIYTNEYKLKIIAERKQEIITIRNNVKEEIEKLFNNEIEKLEKENNYIDKKPEETANILKMLELSKSNISEAEVKHLLKVYENNNIIKRILVSIAESKNMNIERFNFVPNTIELEELKQHLLGVISLNEAEVIESIKLELLLRSMG